MKKPPVPQDMIAQYLLELKREPETEADKILVPAPFSLTCRYCDHGDAVGTRMQADAEGWKDIDFDPSGPFWNYLGDCPTCIKEGKSL